MLQVRNVPDDVHEELRRRASAARMSLSDFAGQSWPGWPGGPPSPTCLTEPLAATVTP